MMIMKNKIAFIIPGFTEDSKEKKYQDIARMFQKRGIKPIIVGIDWKRKVMSDYVAQFLKEAEKCDAKEIYILGFSFGAVISFISSQKINPKTQILCSLSPYFKEDLPHIRARWKNFMGKKRIADFECNFSAKKIAKSTKCKTYLLAGTEEGIEVERRFKATGKEIKNCESIKVHGSKHDISNPEYLNEISKIIKTL